MPKPRLFLERSWFFALRLAMVSASSAFSISIINWPIIATALILIPSAIFLLISPILRTIFVVFGGMLILQSTDTLNIIKIWYLAGVVLAFMGTTAHIILLKDRRPLRLTRPVLVASGSLAFLCAISLPVSLDHDTSFVAWLRDVAPYGLVSAAPLFALDCAVSTSRKTVVTLLVATGSLAAISFSVEWLHRRDLASLPVDRLLLPTFFLPAALFSYAVSAAVVGGGRQLRWWILAVLTLALLAVTGTRSSAILLVGLIVAVLLEGRTGLRRRLRWVWLPPVLSAVGLILAALIASAVHIDRELAKSRVEQIYGLVTEPSHDQSLRLRLDQSRIAWETFLASPFLGVGPGHLYEWTLISGRTRTSNTLDTPLVYLARFGIVGLVSFVVWVIGMVRFMVRLPSNDITGRVSRSALWAFAGVAAAGIPLSVAWEDKGFGYGLILLVALCLTDGIVAREMDVCAPSAAPD